MQGSEGCLLCFPPRPAPAPPESAWAPPPHTHPAPRHCRGSPKGETEARREAERDCRVTQARIPPRVSSLPQFPAVSHLGRVGPHLGSPPAQRTGYISSQVSRDSAWGLSCKLHLRTSASPPGGPCRPACGHHPLPGLQPLPPARGTLGAPSYPARSHSSVPSFLS